MARKMDEASAEEYFKVGKQEIRDCMECNLIYYGGINCPVCKGPTGEPLPDKSLVKILTDSETIY